MGQIIDLVIGTKLAAASPANTEDCGEHGSMSGTAPAIQRLLDIHQDLCAEGGYLVHSVHELAAFTCDPLV